MIIMTYMNALWEKNSKKESLHEHVMTMVSKIHHGVEQIQILLWYAYKLVMDVSGGNSMTLANEILEDCYTRIHALDPLVLETKWLICYVGL